MKQIKVLTCIWVCCLLLAGCGPRENINNEVFREYEPSDAVLMYPEGAGIRDTAWKDAPEGYEKVLENEYLALYIGAGYDIVVYEKATGNLTCSNEVYLNMDAEERKSLNSQAKNALFSQVSIEYYTSSLQKMTMSSYPDAYSDSKNQIKWSVEDDSLIVTYGMGNNMEESALIQCFTPDTYNTYLTKLQELVDNGQLSAMEIRPFKQQYLECIYENLDSSTKKTYSEAYPAFEELGKIYVLKSNISASNANKLLALYTVLGIDETVGEAESLALGGSGAVSKAAYFKIPVKFRLHGNDLLVSVDLQDIEQAEGFHLTKVDFMKGFGATLVSEDGYIFAPDGSGTIIRNDLDSNSMNSMSVAFYGLDQAREITESTSIAMNNTLPVFGIKKDDRAVFAIVENGAAVGGMTAQTHNSYSDYNMVYPYFYYETLDSFGWETIAYAFYDIIPDVEYTVRYHFLSGEDSTYSGMAQYYQQYLIQKGVLQRQEESIELGLDIELLGSIQKTVNYFGIPFDTLYPLTSFKQAQEITDILHEGGVGNFNLLYSGIVNGGINQKALNKITIQKELGGEDDYQELSEYLASAGDVLYPGLNPAMIGERGNGIRRAEDVSKTLNKTSAFVGERNETFITMNGLYQWLVNPLRYPQITSNFLGQAPKLETKTLYLESVGAYLNGNYSENQGVTRLSTQYLTEDMLQSICDAGYELKLDKGNDYVLQYAESLINIPTSSSHQRIESYSIPFVGMVLKGYIPYTCRSLNQESNRTKALLEAVESGAGLSYLLIYDSQLNLQDTDLNHLFSVNYQINMTDILETWNRLNADMGYLQSVRMVDHVHLSDDVNCVIYEDGSKVYVNYGKEAYRTDDGIVEAESYLVIGGA